MRFLCKTGSISSPFTANNIAERRRQPLFFDIGTFNVHECFIVTVSTIYYFNSSRKRFIISSRAVLAACELSWPIFIYLFEYIYRSFPVGVRIQCDVTQHKIMYFWSMVHYCVSFMNSSSVREIFTLSVNNEQIPSMQMTHKSKHNNPGVKKWIQILAGESSSGASIEYRLEI